MTKQNKKKVILAFSGGLDTSFSVPYLIDKGFEVITVTVDSGGFSKSEIKQIEEKSKKLGAKKHYTVNAKIDLYNQIVKNVIQTNGLYEGSYPNMCADRYLIAEKCIEVAQKEKATSVAHGSTAMGNDQIRFDLALQALDPKIQIIEPIKEMGGNREEEKTFLKKKGFEVPGKHSEYSINKNLMGITYSGSEIDQNKEPKSKMFELVTGEKVKESKYYEIEFKEGLPVKLNGKKLSGVQIIQILNKELGKYGYGKNYYTGDCVIGIKGHIVIEAPALYFLIAAHKALEQYTLTKEQITFGQLVAQKVTDLIYIGKYYEPVVENLNKFIGDQQKNVNGKVKMKLEFGNALAVEIQSHKSLINPKIATYAQGCTWTTEDANGFIKLFDMQTKISKLIN